MMCKSVKSQINQLLKSPARCYFPASSDVSSCPFSSQAESAVPHGQGRVFGLWVPVHGRQDGKSQA